MFIPIHTKKTSPQITLMINQHLLSLISALESKGVRCHFDDRSHLRIGAKYYEWERKGVPIRVVLGERDLAYDIEKCDITLSVFDRIAHDESKWCHTDNSSDIERFVAKIENTLASGQQLLYQRAEQRLHSQIYRVSSYEEMKQGISEKAGLYLVPWKENSINEEKIKGDCKATIRCYPLKENQLQMPEGVRCFYSGEQASHWALFGRAY